MKFGLLGPLRAEDGGHSLVPSAPKQRQLLALLLFNSGQVIPADTCIDELWDESPPDSARSTLQTYVLHLRKRLGRAPAIGGRDAARSRLETRNGGYRFVVYPGELDVEAFRWHARAGREALKAGQDAEATAQLSTALNLWAGATALVDVAQGPLLRTYVTGLEEQRLSVLEQRIEADLRLGRHHELLSELSELVVRHPMNENLQAQLMLALYRSGRPARALQVFRELRVLLKQEMGIGPSPRLRMLHEAILAEEPALDVPAHSASSLSLDMSRLIRRAAPIG
jgi:DNA-binding SARP family transcriptional activator